MPTKKPRVSVTLDQDTYDTLKHFAGLMDQSMGSIAAEMLTEATPMLKQTIAMAEQLQKRLENASDAHRRAIRDEVDQLSDVVAERRQELLGMLNAVELPPSTNRGVTPKLTTVKKDK